MPSLELRVAPLQTSAGTLRASAAMRSTAHGERELWYEVDESHRDAVVDRADPFVLAALVHAMHEGNDLDVRGRPVSTSLLRNLDEFQQIWHAWFKLPVVDLVAEEEVESNKPTRSAVSTFSGGIDSSFTAYTSATQPSPRHPPLEAGLMLHGMDIPRADAAGFEGAFLRSKKMADSLHLDLITVRTNAWELLSDTRMHFPVLGVAAALHLLGGRFGTGLIASTASYAQPILPLDSTPMSDSLLRSEEFEIVHYGAAYSRLDKLRQLLQWDEAMDNLRVCIEAPRHDRNCGRCRKCMQTYLEFRVLDVEPRCFDDPPPNDVLLTWAGTFSSHRLFVNDMIEIVEEADRRGLRQPWVRAAKRRLRVIATRRALTALSPTLSRRSAQFAWKLQRR